MIIWSCTPFDALTPNRLYTCLTLRQAVFVVEQACPYLDADGADQYSHHIIGEQQGSIVAYARLVAPGIKYPEPSLGRILTASSVRSMGIGHQLLKVSLDAHTRLYPQQANRIGAQAYLQKFYESVGFQRTSDTIYLEDNIPHMEMLWPAEQERSL